MAVKRGNVLIPRIQLCMQLMFRELVHPILEVSRMCLANGDEDVAILAFEIFDDLVESPAPLLGPAIPVIVQFALEVSSNKQLEFNTRDQVCGALPPLPPLGTFSSNLAGCKGAQGFHNNTAWCVMNRPSRSLPGLQNSSPRRW